jgi:hypothetical protein
MGPIEFAFALLNKYRARPVVPPTLTEKPVDPVDRLLHQYTELCVGAGPPSKKLRSKLRKDCPSDLARLCAHPLTKSLVVHQTCLIANTHMVSIEGRAIGRYLVVVDAMPFAQPMLCFNQSIVYGDCHGPHVDKDGTMCLKRGSEHIAITLQKDGKLADLVLFAYTALSTWTPGYAYVPLNSWPHIKE